MFFNYIIIFFGIIIYELSVKKGFLGVCGYGALFSHEIAVFTVFTSSVQLNFYPLPFTAPGLTFSRFTFPVAFPDTFSTMENLSMTAQNSSAMKIALVDIVAIEFLAGGGPLEQLAGTGDSPRFLSFPSQAKPVSPSLPSLLDGFLFGDFTEPWVLRPSKEDLSTVPSSLPLIFLSLAPSQHP